MTPTEIASLGRDAERLHAWGMLPSVPNYGPALLPVPEPTRVAFAGCWHSQHHLVGGALQAAKDQGADVVVHTGDLLYTGAAAQRALWALEHAAIALNMFVVAVRGNHDDPALFRKAVLSTRSRTRKRPHSDPFARLSTRVLHAPNAMRWEWAGVTFAALGGAYSVDRPARVEGQTYWAGEVATDADIRQVAAGGKVTALITHDIPAPAGGTVPLPLQRPDWWDIAGAEADRERGRVAVEASTPDWIIGGHLHVRHTGGVWLPGGHQVRVEVLDKIESGVEGNLLVADLIDGQIVPVGE